MKNINFNQLIYTALSMLVFSFAQAASFNCDRASSKIEHLICADADLSQLDSNLGALFDSQKNQKLTLISDQKKWLKDKREQCQTVSCLKIAYAKRIQELKETNACPLGEADLMGSWVRVKGSAFEEMAFTKDNNIQSFVSWIHHYPEMTGTWKLVSCSINVKHSTEEKLQFDLKIKSYSKGKLTVIDTDSNDEVIYKKSPSK